MARAKVTTVEGFNGKKYISEKRPSSFVNNIGGIIFN